MPNNIRHLTDGIPAVWLKYRSDLLIRWMRDLVTDIDQKKYAEARQSLTAAIDKIKREADRD